MGTVTSNGGLESWLKALGLGLERTPVGDRHVAEAMARLGVNLGGESSGHVLTPGLCPSGDGVRVALEVLRRAAALGEPLSALLSRIPRFPSAGRKLRSTTRPALATLPALGEAMAAADAALGPTGGRQLVRWSGTEPVLRILVEGPDTDLVEAWADRLEVAARAALGA